VVVYCVDLGVYPEGGAPSASAERQAGGPERTRSIETQAGSRAGACLGQGGRLDAWRACSGAGSGGKAKARQQCRACGVNRES